MNKNQQSRLTTLFHQSNFKVHPLVHHGVIRTLVRRSRNTVRRRYRLGGGRPSSDGQWPDGRTARSPYCRSTGDLAAYRRSGGEFEARLTDRCNFGLACQLGFKLATGWSEDRLERPSNDGLPAVTGLCSVRFGSACFRRFFCFFVLLKWYKYNKYDMYKIQMIGR